MSTETVTETVKNLPLGEIDVSNPLLYQNDSWRPYFARLRREAPVHYCANGLYGPFWSVSSYDLIGAVELNHTVFSNRADLGGIQLLDIAPDFHRPSFVSMDPPEHTGRRRAVTPMTNRSSLARLSDVIRSRTAEVLDSLPRDAEFNWVEKVSVDLTSRMLATMFAFPQERRHELMYWSDVATTNIYADDALVKTEEERYAKLQEMADAFMPFWQARTNDDSGFDLITMLANNSVTQNMDREELIGTLFLLIVGGNDTTRNSMTGGLLALSENPDAWDRVRADQSLIPNMVQEMIRYQTPVLHMRRTALSDTELNGQTITKGDKVVLWYVSANFDDTVFQNAERFDIERQNSRRHLSFGAGIHRCVGDRLAALQLSILWEEILQRDIRIDIAGPPERIYSNFIRGISNLPVRIAQG